MSTLSSNFSGLRRCTNMDSHQAKHILVGKDSNRPEAPKLLGFHTLGDNIRRSDIRSDDLGYPFLAA